MIHKVTKQYDKNHVLSLLDPIIHEWFNRKFSDLTPPQAYAVPLIHEKRNVLIASPTGSGKTLTAFLTIINELFILGRNDQLENKVYCVYISPLKALANDIERNLNQPLKEIYELAEEKGITLPKIRVGVRSGDTSAYEKQKMVKNSPHILITTPETLAIVLSTVKFRENLRDVKYIIVDEIHDVCSSKRGVFLSVSLERLQYLTSINNSNNVNSSTEPPNSPNSPNSLNSQNSLTRIGLSATQAPINEIAKFLVGYEGKKLRDVHIIEALFGKQLDLSVLCPVQDMNLVPFEIVNAKMYNKLQNMIDSHRTTLVFTNTRSGTEAVVFKLNELGIDKIAAHHGSLSKEVRLDVEEKLKNGELDATITSTSLELGIDIGYIDLVCQIGSPKSIAKGLQRIGRAGHALHEVSKGRIIVFDRDDLVECTVLVKSSYDGNIDRISIPRNSLDVLGQVLIGMSLEQRWQEKTAYDVIQNSYCFHNLSRREFKKVLNFIAGRHTLESSGVYGKIWYDPSEKTFGIRRGSRLIYNLNVGTIPQETAYKVVLFGAGMPLGSLSEKFVERLNPGDIFILGGKTYECIQVKGMRVLVKDAHGRKPTVPSWSGEMLPRSFDLSTAIGKFRGILGSKLEGTGDDGAAEEVMKWLSTEYNIDEGSARSIVNYIIEQQGINPLLPTNKHVVIEGYIDARGDKNLVFHYCFGRRVNDALSRAYANALSKKYKCTIRISLTDDNFMLTLPKRIQLSGIEKLISSENLLENLKSAVRNTELFKQRFRHNAVRSFMILRNYKGKEISIRKQHYRAQRVLDIVNGDEVRTKGPGRKKKSEQNEFDEIPVISETYNEILHEAMDIDNARKILKGLESGKITVSYSQFSNIPSPFAHNVVLIGISDIVLMEDRSALLRELHKQVLAKVVSKHEMAQSKFEIDLVEKYFSQKIPRISNKQSIIQLLRTIGPLRLFVEKGRNIFNYSTKPRQSIIKWSRELVNSGEVTSFWRGDTAYVPVVDLPLYYAVYGKVLRPTKTVQEMIKAISADKVPDRLDRKQQEDLRKLEKHFLAYRKKVESYGVYRWALRDIQELKKSAPPFDEALDTLLLNYLEFHGVSTIAELGYELGIDEELVQKILRELEDRNHITSGNFVMGKDLPQFMLLKDMLKLELLAAEKSGMKSKEDAKKTELVMDQTDFMEFLLRREFKPIPGIQEFFDKYLVAFDERDIFLRVKNFDLQEWHSLLKRGEVIRGRFHQGRVCYIRRRDIGPVISLYRRAELNILDKKVLDYIKTRVANQHSGDINSASIPTDVKANSDADISSVEVSEAAAVTEPKATETLRGAEIGSEGVTRSELISALKYKESDVIDSIDKLDYNLYIGRSKRDTREYGILNRYISLELEDVSEESIENLLKQFIRGYGPIPFLSIKSFMRLQTELLKDLLDKMVDEGELFKLVVIGEGPMEMYADAKIRPAIVRFNSVQAKKSGTLKSKIRPKVRILSQTDPLARRFEFGLNNKFGEDWHSMILDGTVPSGVINFWKLASCIELRNIDFDSGITDAEREELLDATLKELDNLMKFYGEKGLDILKIKSIDDTAPAEFPARLKSILKDNGYELIQGDYVKGNVIPVTFSKEDVLNFIFYQQHIHPSRRFDDPMEIIQNFGGIRSTFELHLRLNGRAYDLKEYGRHHDLAQGQMIPEFLMYCTESDARIYKTAKGLDTDNRMKHILSHIPEGCTVKSTELRNRVNLTEPAFKAAMKKLYEGLFVIKTPFNYYKTLKDAPDLNRASARKLVIKRVFENFGIFTAEGLAAFLKRGYSMDEIRAILRTLESDGVLVKGYLVEGKSDLYWILKGSEKKIRKLPKLRERFILSPQDQLCHYLIEDIRQRFSLGSCFVIFDGSEMTGAFKASKRTNRLIVSEFIGSDDDWTTLRHFAHKHRLELLDEEEEERYNYDDLEI